MWGGDRGVWLSQAGYRFRHVTCSGLCGELRIVSRFFVSSLASSDGVRIGVWLKCGAVWRFALLVLRDGRCERIGKAVSRDVWDGVGR